MGFGVSEVYPDEVLVRDPFEQPRPDKIVSRLLYRSWPMELRLPDLGTEFFAIPIKVPSDPAAGGRKAAQGRFSSGARSLVADAR